MVKQKVPTVPVNMWRLNEIVIQSRSLMERLVGKYNLTESDENLIKALVHDITKLGKGI